MRLAPEDHALIAGDGPARDRTGAVAS